MRRAARLALCLMALSLTACAASPPDRVTDLSARMEQDLAQLHQHNLRLTDLLFARLEADAERFIATTYRPAYLHLLLQAFDLEAEVQQAAGQDPEALRAVLEDVVDRAVTDVDSARMALLQTIRSAHRATVREVETRFGQVRAGQAAVSAWLASAARRAPRASTQAKPGADPLAQAAALSADLQTLNAASRCPGAAAPCPSGDWAAQVKAMDDAIQALEARIREQAPPAATSHAP